MMDCIYGFIVCTAVALQVFQRPQHTLLKMRLNVVPREMPASASSQAVLLTGIIQRSHSEEYIRLYFENRRCGNSRPIEDLFVDYERQLAVVTFDSAQCTCCT